MRVSARSSGWDESVARMDQRVEYCAVPMVDRYGVFSVILVPPTVVDPHIGRVVNNPFSQSPDPSLKSTARTRPQNSIKRIELSTSNL